MKKFLSNSIKNKLKHPIRVLVASLGNDGFDPREKFISSALRDNGMEVIYSGFDQTPEMIVNTALQEDVDVIGVTVQVGSHMTIFPEILKLMKEKRLNNVLLTGGGTLSDSDMIKLNAQGVGRVFSPQADTMAIAGYIKEWVEANEVH